jgi:hypothetical protein
MLARPFQETVIVVLVRSVSVEIDASDVEPVESSQLSVFAAEPLGS